MNPFRHVARLSALAMAVTVVWACDQRIGTPTTSSISSPIDDVERPAITFALSTGSNNVVEIGSALSVNVTGTDNNGVGSMLTRVTNGAQVIGEDSTVITPIQKTVSRVVQISMGGVASGDRIVVRTTATDGVANQKTDSLVFTIGDTTKPSVTVFSSKANGAVKGGDVVDARVTANDSAGIAYAGYRLFLATDTVPVRSESTSVANGTRVTSFQTPVYGWVVPDTLATGNYALVPFALDRSGLYTKAGKTTANFIVVDVTKPAITLLSPLAGATQKIGDSLLVTAHITDNIALQKVSFVGFSVRGSTTVIRYPQVTATPFRAGLRDTLIQRYLKVPTSGTIDAVADTLIVTGVVSDASNNVDTVRVKLQMSP